MEQQVLLVASSTEGNVTAWDLETCTSLTSFKGCACPPGGLVRCGPDYLLAAQVGKGSIHAWAWHKDHVHQRSFAPEPLAALACSPDGRWVAGGGASGTVHVWESSTGRLLKSWPAHYKSVAALVFSDDGSVLVSGGADTLVHAWLLAEALDASAGAALALGGAALQPLHAWSDHTLPVSALALGAGGAGALLASSSLDRSVRLRSLGSGTLLRSVALPAPLHSLALDPGEHALYAGAASGVIYEIDLVAGGGEGGAAASPGSAAAAAPLAGSGGSAAAAAAAAAALPPGVSPLEGHARPVTCLAITADGEQLVSGSEDQSVRVWDLRSRQPVRLLPSPAKGPVTALLVLDRPPHMQVGGAHLASSSGTAAASAGARKGPKRPQPLAPFSKFANAPGPVKPWEGGLVVLDGSSALARSVGAIHGSSASGGWTGAGSSEVQASEALHQAAAAAGSSGSAADGTDALREENEQLRAQLAQATALAASWGKLNGQLQTFCADVLLQGGAR